MTTTSNRDSHFFVAGFNCHMHRKDANAVWKETAATAPAAVGGPAYEREAFEAWAREKTDWKPNLERKGDGYAGGFAQTAWEGWRGRGAALALEAPAAPMSTAEACATLAINSALHRIRGGNAAGAIEPLEQAHVVLAALRQTPAAPVALPWRTGIPQWTDDTSVRVIAVTAHDDFGGAQVHDIRATDFYIDGDGVEIANLCTHWAYRDDIWPRADTAAPAAPVDDLAQLVKQLVRALRKAAPGNELADKALDYLKRQGLQGSPLRTTPEAAAVDATAQAARDAGFNHGVCLALQIMASAGNAGAAEWTELLDCAGRDEIMHYAQNIEPESWQLCGFDAIAAQAAATNQPAK